MRIRYAYVRVHEAHAGQDFGFFETWQRVPRRRMSYTRSRSVIHLLNYGIVGT